MSNSEALARELLGAVLADNGDKVKSLLKQGANPDHNIFYTKDFTPPVHYACLKGNVYILKILVSGGASTRRGGGQDNMTPLHWASRYGHDHIVLYLVGNDLSDLSAKDEKGRTAVDHAAEGVFSQGGYVDILHLFFEKVPTTGQHKLKLMMGACRRSRMDIVKEMVEKHNIKPDAHDDDGDTPLHEACAAGDTAIAKYFIESLGCPVNIKGIFNNSIFHCACNSGDLELVKYLYQHHKPDLNARGNFGRSPLHYACDEAKLEVVEYLVVTLKDNPIKMDSNAHTPFHRACCARDGLPLVKFMVEKLKIDYKELARKAKANGTDTFLHPACMNGSMPTVRYLVEELNCNFIEYHGSNKGCPIHQACSKGQLEVIQYLIEELKCDPNMTGINKMTPLHYASYEGHLDVVKYLTPKVGTAVRDEFGRTPIDIAEQGDKTAVVDFLKAQPAEPTAPKFSEPAATVVQHQTPAAPAIISQGLNPLKGTNFATESVGILQGLLQNLNVYQKPKSYPDPGDSPAAERRAQCLRTLRRSLWDIRSQWEELSIDLAISCGTREAIRKKHSPEDVGGRFTSVLEEWLNLRPKLGDLIEVLKSPMLNQYALGEELEIMINKGELSL